MDGAAFGTFGEIFGRLDQWPLWLRILSLAVMFFAFTITRYFVAAYVTKSPRNELRANAVTFLILFGIVLVIAAVMALNP
ncbi:MAG: hypothetical protein IPO30_14180 [Hyphomonadaceae bacterium]|nr:hypothetical protein [Hyphomonadaceae bacterium]MBP9233443.1 hypothetical protein [Hyphomonadaceae bacterium]